jgi:hypothetical protein
MTDRLTISVQKSFVCAAQMLQYRDGAATVSNEIDVRMPAGSLAE